MILHISFSQEPSLMVSMEITCETKHGDAAIEELCLGGEGADSLLLSATEDGNLHQLPP